MIKVKKENNFSKSFFKTRLLFPLMLLSLASYGVMQLTPVLVQGSNTSQPTTLQLAFVGSAIIVFSALFLKYVARMIGMTSGWLLLGVLFSSCIIITKFILIPSALYSQVFTLTGAFDFDPNSSSAYSNIAVGLFAVYGGIFWLAYRHYRKKVNHALNIQKTKGRKHSRSFIAVLALLTVVILLTTVAAALLLGMLVTAGATFSYVNYAVAGGGLLLALTTAGAIILSVKYLEDASNKAIEVKNATILTITFWVGLSLILVFHILWVIYMGILLAIWPFRTISPSGK